MKHTRLALIIAMLWMFSMGHPQGTYAQELLQRVEIPSSPNPVGSGARALGMSGAFIAVADDATAASWNPGGLIQLELPEVSFVLSAFHRIEDISFANSPLSGGDQTVTLANLNYFSAAYPFSLFGLNMIVSLNYQNLYDFHRKWDFPITMTGDDFTANQTIDYLQEGNLSALGLAYAIQATPTLSFGITFNFWDERLPGNQWEQKTYQWGTGMDAGDTFQFAIQSYDRYTFNGFNMNFGMMWNITPKLSLGAVLKTPFDADLEHEHRFNSALIYPYLPGFGSQTSSSFNRDETLSMPMSIGAGLSYRFSDVFTASMDIYRTEWDDFSHTDAQGKETSPISGKPMSEADIDPTHQFRIGAEYLLLIRYAYIVPLRFGLFYDPAPAEGSPDDYFGFSIGSGIGYKRFIFDIAYQMRSGKDVGQSILGEWGFSQDVEEHILYTSLIIHF